MPVTIDEVTAEVAPPEPDGRGAAAPPAQASPEQQLRQHRERHERLERRAARLKAD